MKGFYINLYTSIKQFKNLFDSRLTDARARKLDKIDSTITSRATQASVDNVRDKVQLCENTNANLLSKVEKLLSVPSGGVSGKFVSIVWMGQGGVKVTVTGSGVLRLVRSTLSSQPSSEYKHKYEVIIDGKWVTQGAVPIGHDENIASGGIRFNSYFKIYVHEIPHVEQSIFYSYTLGD